MRCSIAIFSHNEGALLGKTIQSCLEVTRNLDCEIVVCDDASTDGCYEEALDRFPDVRGVRFDERRGVSPTKDRGIRECRGRVVIFLDGHCKPEPGSIERLVESVEKTDGESVILPRVPDLHVRAWENKLYRVGEGFYMDLVDYFCDWMTASEMRQRGEFLEDPTIVGCCGAISAALYDKLGGFDTGMLEYGVEDVDFGLKTWLSGHSVLLDGKSLIGHRFLRKVEHRKYDIAPGSVVVNKLRSAWKNFPTEVWDEWLVPFRARYSSAPYSEGYWDRAWQLFQEGRESADRERELLEGLRVHDVYWYAERFGLDWPKR